MKNKLFRIPFFIVVALAAAFLFGMIAMLLWNELIPVIFHLPLITFWQAFGLLILFRILFGGFGFHGDHHRRWKYHDLCSPRFEEKLKTMSPEDKEKFFEVWKKHFETRFQPSSDSKSDI